MDAVQNMSLVQMVYVSEARGRLSNAELMSIVHAARRWNEKRDITSLLFYKDGYFGQVLEGGYDAVSMACNRIMRDSNHYRIIQLASKPIQSRLIPSHALKFYGSDGLDRKHPSLSEVLVGDRANKENLLRLILLASINL
ncbi:BLUF domain-containing protein [Polynucleobacter sp. AM-25C3]|uniref:BLUF domain-containing protein n=1 Tax=Polynucleobacter sp. AM-25C3 TaxID=1855569 RepID=UPI001C0D87AC|nr:BLUF domain-containing protein [Polynucleobacter sp. AM-25C3]MBU3602822.1 BLUF domain-containing protein [Polynucleobacter sp. AM-25C3]